MAHPNISEAGVIGKDDSEWGSIPIGFVVLSKQVTEAELREYCEARLARYKIPVQFHFVSELPRNASNKLLRRELRKWLDLL